MEPELCSPTHAGSFKLEFGERQPARHLQSVLVLRGKGHVAQDSEQYGNDRDGREFSLFNRGTDRIRDMISFPRSRSKTFSAGSVPRRNSCRSLKFRKMRKIAVASKISCLVFVQCDVQGVRSVLPEDIEGEIE